MTNLDIILLISITLTYFVYSSVDGFKDIIEKTLKVKGNVNLIINTILFMLLIRLVIDNVPVYLNIIEIIYNKIFNPSKLTEGQGLSSDDLSSEDFAILTLDRRIEDIVKLIKKNYIKHDKMEESKEKDKLFAKLLRWQTDVDNLNMAKAAVALNS
tara:strand:+ start:23 stop:490 length:468 start_codon:yes stop_codon:yes gene_type:complete